MKKSWGVELWLNATRPEAAATLHEDQRSLADLLRAEPELLGAWTRQLFGDELPIFTKLLRTDFPPLVHVGFRKQVDRAQLLGWLVEEQVGLRELLAHVGTREAFEPFSRAYAAWATAEGQAAWLRAEAPGLGVLDAILQRLRTNRARIVDVLNEVDLRHEAGNLLLTGAGMVHAIFGLSHQFHAKDGTRSALETLLVRLRRDADRGVSEEALRATARTVDLAALRSDHRAPPKNEGWLPVLSGDELLLVEPQQSSDTTFSIADFYTPFVWDSARVKFRKGDPTTGLSQEDLASQLEDIDFAVTHLDEIRHHPRKLDVSTQGAEIYELIDDPAVWPFFTAHELRLDAASLRCAQAQGTFQQLVVLDGTLELADERGTVGTLARDRPAFIPATLPGAYTLTARNAARALVLSVPGPHRAKLGATDR